MAAIKEDFPIRIVNGGTDGEGSFWITRTGEKIAEPQDLKGKRFAYSRPKSVSESMIISALNSQGINPDDAKLVAAGDIGAGITALEHDKVDIAIIPEPIYSIKEKEGTKFQIIPWLGSKLPRFTQTVGIATTDVIEKRGKELSAVIKGRRRGVEFQRANPEEAAKIVGEAYNLDPAVVKSAVTNIL